MNYTKKKIVIEAQIPDGATHCLQCSSGIAAWFKVDDDKTSYWDYDKCKWTPQKDLVIHGSVIQPIEVIE